MRSDRRLPAAGERRGARVLGYLLIAFSPIPLVMMLVSWGSDVFGSGSLVPEDYTVIGGLYGLLGLVSFTFGLVLSIRYYRGKEVEYTGRRAPAPAWGGPSESHFKRTAMTRPQPEPKDLADELALARQRLADLRVDFAMERVDRGTFTVNARALEAQIRDLEARLAPSDRPPLHSIPDHNRGRR